MSRWSRRIPGPQVSIDVDLHRVKLAMDELQNTPKEVAAATTRALNNTASALKKMSQMRLRSELALQEAGTLRRRMRTMKTRIKGADGAKVIGLWFGLNDLPVSAFKYQRLPKEYPGGATFQQYEFPGAFVAKVGKGKRSIYKRAGAGRFPLVEQTLPIKDRADRILEDEIFPEATRIFVGKLMHELQYQARKRGG